MKVLFNYFHKDDFLYVFAASACHTVSVTTINESLTILYHDRQIVGDYLRFFKLTFVNIFFILFALQARLC